MHTVKEKQIDFKYKINVIIIFELLDTCAWIRVGNRARSLNQVQIGGIRR